jgi:GNAT superfamily N-acetyltransferase
MKADVKRSLMLNYEIAPARPQDLPFLTGIELAAARLLAGHAPESVLSEATSQEDFDRSRSAGLLWVARCDDVPVGFAQVKVLEPTVAHLDEIDVHPDYGRRGIGTQLVGTVCEWSALNGFLGVTLATFRHVQWNMPFYSKMGFEVISPENLSSALRAVVDDEKRRGLDTTRRVVMQRRSG